MNYDLTADDIPEIEGSTAEQAGAAAPDAQGQPTNETILHEYNANGKVIKEDLDTILKRASQGYNYAQNIAEHKQSVANFEQEREQHLSKYGRWKEMHDYASQNPEWAQFVSSQWENRTAFGQQDQEYQQEPVQNQPAVDPEIRAFMEEYRQDKQRMQEQREDEALGREIESVQKMFPDFDLSSTDPATGMSLEKQVLEHASNRGINSFQAAFKDLLFDQIVERKITASKEQAAREISSRLKQGHVTSDMNQIAAFTPPARRGSGPMSMHDAVMEGAQELGIL